MPGAPLPLAETVRARDVAAPLPVFAGPGCGPMKVRNRIIRENMMRRASRLWKKAVAGICGLVLGSSAGCLPDNFFADKAGEIVNGLITSGINIALADTDLEI